MPGYHSPKKKHCFKMKASGYDNNPMKKNFPEAFKFNAELKKASADGLLDNNPKFKAAVDSSMNYGSAYKKMMQCSMCTKRTAMGKCNCGKNTKEGRSVSSAFQKYGCKNK